MRRREVLAGLGAAGTLALAGCACESWPGVGYVVRHRAVESDQT
jgi:hypothetical protein